MNDIDNIKSILLPNIQKAWKESKSFQVEDAKFAAENGKVVLGHNTGLGKTFISLLAWSLLRDVNKVLIVGTLSSISVWRRSIKEWGGGESIFIQGYSDPEWGKALKSKQGIYMMTYATFRGLMSTTKGPVKFDLHINDELHRALRNRNTQVYKAMLRLDCKYYFGLSATWSSRGPQDLFPVLHLINKSLFSSYWKFVGTWCYVERSSYGIEILGVKNAANLRKMLTERYYRARTYKEVAHQFVNNPTSAEPVIRRVITLPMTKQQSKINSDLSLDMIATLDSTTVITPTSLAKLTRMLQVAICPKILFPTSGYGTIIEWLVDQIAEEPHTVIFTPFTGAITCIQEALVADKYPADSIFSLRGGMNPDEVDATISAWKKNKGVIICTIAFAQSFSLDTVNVAHMAGFSWDPNDNIQAEGRLRRMDSVLQTPCLVNYIVVEGSAYEEVKEVVNGKIFNVQQFLRGYGISKT